MSHEADKFEEQLSRIMEQLGEHSQMLSAILRHTEAEKGDILKNLKEIKFREGERLYDNQDLCIMLRLSKRSLQRYRSLGLLPYLMLRQKTYYKESDVVQFLIGHLKDFKKEDIEAYKASLK